MFVAILLAIHKRQKENADLPCVGRLCGRNSNALLTLMPSPPTESWFLSRPQREFCNRITLRADMELGQYGLGNQHRGPIKAGLGESQRLRQT
jgi:hypothetical protein